MLYCTYIQNCEYIQYLLCSFVSLHAKVHQMMHNRSSDEAHDLKLNRCSIITKYVLHIFLEKNKVVETSAGVE